MHIRAEVAATTAAAAAVAAAAAAEGEKDDRLVKTDCFARFECNEWRRRQQQPQRAKLLKMAKNILRVDYVASDGAGWLAGRQAGSRAGRFARTAGRPAGREAGARSSGTVRVRK